MSSRLKFKTTSHAPSIKKIEVLQLENKRLARENEELKRSLEWKDIDEYQISYGRVLLHDKIKGGYWVDFKGSGEAHFLTPLGEIANPTHFKLITPPTQEGDA